ncbi:MAG: hypothetical protein ABL888_12565 [Pirellulaceae bacterium]
MKRFLLLVAVALSFATVADSANAQGYHNGYAFGLGVNNSFPVIGQSYFVREDIPYFAKFPPVYYSHIVRRPYGVSPYAAPPGIAPIELSIPAIEPQVIMNPYAAPEVAPGIASEGTIPPSVENKPLIRTEEVKPIAPKTDKAPANKTKEPAKTRAPTQK